jgi:hypothetical protein
MEKRFKKLFEQIKKSLLQDQKGNVDELNAAFDTRSYNGLIKQQAIEGEVTGFKNELEEEKSDQAAKELEAKLMENK